MSPPKRSLQWEVDRLKTSPISIPPSVSSGLSQTASLRSGSLSLSLSSRTSLPSFSLRCYGNLGRSCAEGAGRSRAAAQHRSNSKPAQWSCGRIVSTLRPTGRLWVRFPDSRLAPCFCLPLPQATSRMQRRNFPILRDVTGTGT